MATRWFPARTGVLSRAALLLGASVAHGSQEAVGASRARWPSRASMWLVVARGRRGSGVLRRRVVQGDLNQADPLPGALPLAGAPRTAAVYTGPTGALLFFIALARRNV
jgi:hypothetical protein